MVKGKNGKNPWLTWLFLAVLGVIFLVIVLPDNIFNSPDEAANYFWARNFAATGQLTYLEPLNIAAGDVIIPRSMRSDDGLVKPVSFLGIILIYGALAKLFTVNIIPYLTPIFAIIGLFYFFFLIKKLFSQNIAWLSTILLATTPAYLYYTNHSMFHNILFLVLTIIALYYYQSTINPHDHKKPHPPYYLLPTTYYYTLSGFFFGLAIITRTSEILWLAPLIIALWLTNIKNFKLKILNLAAFTAALSLAILPMLYFNQLLYGSPLASGYPAAVTANPTLFTFGFHPRLALSMFYHYFVAMFWYLFAPALLGFIWLIARWRLPAQAGKITKQQKFFIIAYVIISTFLVSYYGSWLIHDNINTTHFTIGNSYTRYWLPIYLGATVLAGWGITSLTSLLTNKRWRYLAQILLAALIITFSLNFFYYGQDEGLIANQQAGQTATSQARAVLTLTEPNAIVVTRYNDKYLFPQRRVVVGELTNEKLLPELIKLIKLTPVYYYDLSLSKEKIKQVKFKLYKITEFGNNTLYRLDNIK